jgi:hypothetical protein
VNTQEPVVEMQRIEIPIIRLAGVKITYERTPAGHVVMLIGPLVLGLPMTDEVAKNVAQNLTTRASGIVVPVIGGPS